MKRPLSQVLQMGRRSKAYIKLATVTPGTQTFPAQDLSFPRTQVAQILQRDHTKQELLRFAKLRSINFEPPFWGGGLGET